MLSVYALGDPRTNEIRYIGIARDVYKRYAQHLNRPHPNEAKNAWMDEIKQAGVVPTLAILETDIDATGIYEREKHWIQHYLELGAPLTNIVHVPQQKKSTSALNVSESNNIPITGVLEDQSTYLLRELLEDLPCPFRAFGKKYDISEVTIARLYNGKPALRYTINKLLNALSEVYGKTFTTHNVQGIIVRGENTGQLVDLKLSTIEKGHKQ